MRINLFGGPGSGKSTTAARVFAQLKERLVSVELILEYVKSWAHAKRPVKRFDQVYLFGKQQQYEYRCLASGVKNIITDSPCWLSVFYSKVYGFPPLGDAIETLCKLYDAEHPCTNIFLRRGDKPYVQEGRYQTAEEARKLDDTMLLLLRDQYGANVIEFDYMDRESVLAAVIKAVDL